MGEEAARAGHHRRHHRCALCLSHAAAACGLGGHGDTRGRRGWNGAATSDVIAAAPELPGGFACSAHSRTECVVRSLSA